MQYKLDLKQNQEKCPPCQAFPQNPTKWATVTGAIQHSCSIYRAKVLTPFLPDFCKILEYF